MSEESVEVVRRDIAARHARDWTHLAEIWDPSIELRVVRGGGVFRGFAEITDMFDTLSSLYSEYRVEEIEVLDAGERVVSVEHISGRGLKGSAAKDWISETLFRVIEFDGGKISRITEHPSRTAALEAAGLEG